MLGGSPPGNAMLGDKGYDADWLRAALMARGITPCIPSKANRTIPIPHDRALYRQRHKIENMFGAGAFGSWASADAAHPRLQELQAQCLGDLDKACSATNWMINVLPHRGMFPGPGPVASQECSRSTLALPSASGLRPATDLCAT